MLADQHDVAHLERARGDEERRGRAEAQFELGLDHVAVGAAVRVGLELQHVGLEQDHLEQVVDALAGHGADLADDEVAAPLLGREAFRLQLLADPVGLGGGQVALVDRDHDLHLGLLGLLDDLARLRHDAIVGGDDDHGDVGEVGAAGAHGREGGVARRVEEGDLASGDFDGVGADVLCDAAGLARRDLGLADVVHERGLAVVDMAEEGHHGGTRLQVLGLVLGDVVLGIEAADGGLARRRTAGALELDRVAVLRGDLAGLLDVDALVDRHEDVQLHEVGDQAVGAEAHHLGQILEEGRTAQLDHLVGGRGVGHDRREPGFGGRGGAARRGGGPHRRRGGGGLLAARDGLLAARDGLLAACDGLLAACDGLLAAGRGCRFGAAASRRRFGVAARRGTAAFRSRCGLFLAFGRGSRADRGARTLARRGSRKIGLAGLLGAHRVRLGGRRHLGLAAEIGRGQLLVGVDLLLGRRALGFRFGRFGLFLEFQRLGVDDDLLPGLQGRQGLDGQFFGNEGKGGGGRPGCGGNRFRTGRRGMRGRRLGWPGPCGAAFGPRIGLAGQVDRGAQGRAFALGLRGASPGRPVTLGRETVLSRGGGLVGRVRGQVALERLDLIVIQARQGRVRIEVQRPRLAQEVAARRLQRLGQFEYSHEIPPSSSPAFRSARFSAFAASQILRTASSGSPVTSWR